jgi:hypothetical protein
MSSSEVGYVDIPVPNISTSRKSGDPTGLAADKQVSRQIDELERISQYERDKQLGADYFSDIEDFYNLSDQSSNALPSYRPRVRVPQLQTLVLNEATDLTDAIPKVYITRHNEREASREKFFQANWRQQCYNNRVLEGFLWSMLSNLGFLQLGFNPRARRGRGAVWLESRHPGTVFPDPYAKSESDWTWLILHDWMYIDDVWRQWPDRGRYVKPKLLSAKADPFQSGDSILEYPELSPLSQQGVAGRKIFRDNRVLVRHCYLFDNTRERVRDYAGSGVDSDLLVHPRFQYAYPDGRWITECEGVVLADGNNWCPQLPDDDRGTFPLVRLSAMPAITNFWGPPPVNLTRSLQRLGERILTQTFENVVRLNNGVIVIQNNSGLDKSDIGWMPGEVLMINAGSQAPQVIAPTPIPQHMVTLPDTLFAKQKELQGFSESRQGSTGAGNISPELFDAALWQAKPMTRMRGRLLAESLLRLSQMIFYTQCRYQQVSQQLPAAIRADRIEMAEWAPAGSLDDYDMYLDEGSMKIMSETMLRSTMSGLAKANLLPTKAVLESAGIPEADELAEDKMRELELAAMGRLKRPR